MHESSVTRHGRWLVPTILISIVAVMYFQGAISTLADLLTVVTSAFLTLAALGLLLWYLYRWWEKRNGLAD